MLEICLHKRNFEELSTALKTCMYTGEVVMNGPVMVPAEQVEHAAVIRAQRHELG